MPKLQLSRKEGPVPIRWTRKTPQNLIKCVCARGRRGLDLRSPVHCLYGGSQIGDSRAPVGGSVRRAAGRIGRNEGTSVLASCARENRVYVCVRVCKQCNCKHLQPVLHSLPPKLFTSFFSLNFNRQNLSTNFDDHRISQSHEYLLRTVIEDPNNVVSRAIWV